jgi:hypothetical protein
MDVIVQGKGRICLNRNEFKAAGGEGAVYVKGDVAYKLYGQMDNRGHFAPAPQKMIPLGKVQELSVLTERHIIKPETPILDAAGTPFGYTMRALPNALALCQLFPKAFRDRHHLTPDQMLKLVQRLRAGVAHIHTKGILLVDLNEMNFLVDTAFETVYFIDVDSYQTAHYPATAIMPSIRDPHSATFSPLTDWYSFAIVSFQLLVGIHPYKGTHPTLDTLEARMRANVSVLNAAVKIPPVCQPLAVLPSVYRDWYEAVLERGERLSPPDSPVATAVVVQPVIQSLQGSALFTIQPFGSYAGDVVAVVGNTVLTTAGVWAGAHRLAGAAAGSVLGVTPIHRLPILARVRQGVLAVTDATRQQDLPVSLLADEVMATDGRIYFRQGGLLQELDVTEFPGKLLITPTVVGNVLGQATRLFEGVVIQSLLGATYAGLLPARGQFREIRLAELDTYRVVDARYENHVLVVIGTQQGRYDRLVFRFAEDFGSYDLRTIADVPLLGINVTVLDTGVALLLAENGTLEIFSHSPGNVAVKTVTDPAIGSDSRLAHDGAQAFIARGNRLFTFSMSRH